MPGKGRDSGCEPRNASNTYPYMDGFPPCTIGEENESKGWLKTTMPEGVGFGELAQLIEAGSRGAGPTGKGGNKTVGRTTAKRKVIE